MAFDVKLDVLRNAIAEEIAAQVKAYDIVDECDRLGLGRGTEDTAWRSKRLYVLSLLRGLDVPHLLDVATRFIDDRDAPDLEEVVNQFGRGGVDGEFKNLIFAADDPKPELVFVDAVSNDVKITKHADRCLVYARRLPAAGLTWRDLISWWRDVRADLLNATDVEVGQDLYRRLFASLDSEPERIVFRAYCSFYRRLAGFDLPALVPQVYLHYDPYVAKYRHGPAALARQRMDFLLLLPRRERVVIEVDGVQHYAEGERPSPRLYSEMVAEDRRLRLCGYDVFRFGGYELNLPRAGEHVLEFFQQLFVQRGVAAPDP